MHNFKVGAHTQVVIGLQTAWLKQKSPSFTPHFWLLACNTAVTEASKKIAKNKARIERMSLNFYILSSNLKQITNY